VSFVVKVLLETPKDRQVHEAASEEAHPASSR